MGYFKFTKGNFNVFILIISIFALVFPILFIYFKYPRYYLTSDMVYQIQAALNLLTMNKMVCVNHMPYDLSQSIYDYLSVSPPGYSLVIYLLLRSGFSLSLSLKIFEVIVWFAGILGWAWLSIRYINIGLLKWIFLWIIATMSQNYFYSSIPSLCLWSLMPYWVGFLLKLKDDISEKTAFTYCLILGLIASLAILFRYQAIVFIPCGIVCIIFITGWNRYYSYLKGFFYSLLPILTYGLISVKNFIEKGHSTPLRIGHFDPTWEYLWFIYPLKNVSIDMLQLDKVLTRFLGFSLRPMNMGDVPIHIMPTSVTSFVLTCLIVLGSIVVFVKLLEKGNFSRLFVTIFLVSFFSLTIFLIISGFLIGRGSQPLFRERFFFYLQPLYLLIIFIFLNDSYKKYLKSFIGRTLTATIVFSVLLWGSLSYAKMVPTIRYDFSLKTQIVNEVSQISGGRPDAAIRIVSPDLSGMFVDFNKQLIVYNDNYDNVMWNNYYFSKPTWLFVVSNTEGLRSFKQTANKLGMQSHIVESVTIYYRLFPIGEIKI